MKYESGMFLTDFMRLTSQFFYLPIYYTLNKLKFKKAYKNIWLKEYSHIFSEDIRRDYQKINVYWNNKNKNLCKLAFKATISFSLIWSTKIKTNK